MTSQITALGFKLANLEISTDASVCPALSNTPPILETSGNTWPGETKSLFFDFSLIAVLIVLALSNAEMPVVTPLLDSIETVNAVCILELLVDDISGKPNFLTFFLVSAKHIKPLPCVAIKLIFL